MVLNKNSRREKHDVKMTVLYCWPSELSNWIQKLLYAVFCKTKIELFSNYRCAFFTFKIRDEYTPSSLTNIFYIRQLVTKDKNLSNIPIEITMSRSVCQSNYTPEYSYRGIQLSLFNYTSFNIKSGT